MVWNFQICEMSEWWGSAWQEHYTLLYYLVSLSLNKNICLYFLFLQSMYKLYDIKIVEYSCMFSFWNLTVDFIRVHCNGATAEIYYRHYIDFIVSIVMEEEISAPLCIPVLDTADSDKYLFPPWTIFKNHLSNTPLARIFFCKIQFPWHDRGQKGQEEWRR